MSSIIIIINGFKWARMGLLSRSAHLNCHSYFSAFSFFLNIQYTLVWIGSMVPKGRNLKWVPMVPKGRNLRRVPLGTQGYYPKKSTGMGWVCVWNPWVFSGWVPIKFKILGLFGYYPRVPVRIGYPKFGHPRVIPKQYYYKKCSYIQRYKYY